MIRVDAYQTTDGLKFMSKDEAKRHQETIDRTVFYKVEVKTKPDLSLKDKIFLLNAKEDEMLSRYMKRVSFKNVYIGVKPKVKKQSDYMIEEFLYNEIGNKIGYYEGYGRYERWNYIKTTAEEVFKDSMRYLEYVSEDDSRRLREFKKRKYDDNWYMT